MSLAKVVPQAKAVDHQEATAEEATAEEVPALEATTQLAISINTTTLRTTTNLHMLTMLKTLQLKM